LKKRVFVWERNWEQSKKGDDGWSREVRGGKTRQARQRDWNEDSGAQQQGQSFFPELEGECVISKSPGVRKGD